MTNENIINSPEYIEAQKEITNLRWLLNNRNSESIDFIIKRTLEAEDKVKDLERALEEKDETTQINELKENHRKEIKKMEEKVRSSDGMYSFILSSFVEKNKKYDELSKKLEEKEIYIGELEKSNLWLQEEIKREGETHIGAMRLGGEWNAIEIENQKDSVYKYTKKLAKKVVKIKNLKEELREEREERIKNGRKLTKEKSKNKELQDKLHFATKPLPKTPIKLKITKAKNKFQQLIEKTKQRSQELVARIEVKVK